MVCADATQCSSQQFYQLYKHFLLSPLKRKQLVYDTLVILI